MLRFSLHRIPREGVPSGGDFQPGRSSDTGDRSPIKCSVMQRSCYLFTYYLAPIPPSDPKISTWPSLNMRETSFLCFFVLWIQIRILILLNFHPFLPHQTALKSFKSQRKLICTQTLINFYRYRHITYNRFAFKENYLDF